MIDAPAKQEIAKKLGPLVTPERLVLFFSILIFFSEKSLFSDLNFLNTEISTVVTNATESIKSTKTWIILFVLSTVFIISPILTHQLIKKLSEVSLRHSEPLQKKIEDEAKDLSKKSESINDLKIIAAENSITLRKEAQFVARSLSFIFSVGICLLIYMTGYKIIIPIAIIIAASVFCYLASVELIKLNYEKVYKYRLAATYKEEKKE